MKKTRRRVSVWSSFKEKTTVVWIINQHLSSEGGVSPREPFIASFPKHRLRSQWLAMATAGTSLDLLNLLASSLDHLRIHCFKSYVFSLRCFLKCSLYLLFRLFAPSHFELVQNHLAHHLSCPWRILLLSNCHRWGIQKFLLWWFCCCSLLLLMFMFISACSWRLCGAQRHLHLGGRRGETLTFHFPTFPHIHHIHDHDHQYHLDHLRRTDLTQSALTDVFTQNREKTLAMNIVSGSRFFTKKYDTAKSVS